MATIDINQYIEQSGMRKARFGGYEPDDVAWENWIFENCVGTPKNQYRRFQKTGNHEKSRQMAAFQSFSRGGFLYTRS